jgi:cyclopropane fatty-acyl-phospholipid synthase-like methyltransferase
MASNPAKRFSQSSENNQQSIFKQLEGHFAGHKRVLEIGSGTGQHAVYFAERLGHLIWHTSDRPDNHASIQAWLDESSATNIAPPLHFTIGEDPWPLADCDAVFTANTTHIMQVDEARTMMALVAENLLPGGTFCQYGPMRVDGLSTTASNADFDAQLRGKGFGGIRDIDELIGWGSGLKLVERIPMPANNFLLVWQK